MSTIKVTFTRDRLQVATVEKRFEEICKELFPGTTFHVEKYDPPTTRKERFDRALALVEEANSEFESLKEELDSWLESLPENLQGGSKADELGDAVSELETAVEGCNDVAGAGSLDLEEEGELPTSEEDLQALKDSIEQASESLDGHISGCSDAAGASPEFPSMM